MQDVSRNKACVSPHQGEVLDVQYGGVDDLRRAVDGVNLTGQIAAVKLGRAPLLYKVGSDRCAEAPLRRSENHTGD